MPGADRLCSTHRPDLIDAEDVGSGEHGRVGKTIALRRAGDRQRVCTGGLRGHDVHDHRRRVYGQSAWHIESDALDRQVAGGDESTGGQFRADVDGALIGGDLPGAVDGLDERSPDRGIEFRRGLCQCGFRHAQGFGTHSVEAFGDVLHRGRSPAGDGVEQLGHPSFDIGMGLGGPRQLLRQESLIEGLTTEVQNVHPHHSSLRSKR